MRRHAERAVRNVQLNRVEPLTKVEQVAESEDPFAVLQKPLQRVVRTRHSRHPLEDGLAAVGLGPKPALTRAVQNLLIRYRLHVVGPATREVSRAAFRDADEGGSPFF